MKVKEFDVLLRVRARLEDDEATAQTVRYLIEQDLEDMDWDVDVEVVVEN